MAVAVPGTEDAGAGKGLRGIDPDRYSSLHHPGDAYAFDMYTQVARALRDPGAVNPLDGLQVQHLLAVGESQSAFTLTTYYDGVQPLTQAFDGFFIHSRGGAPAPLSSPNGYIDIAGSISGKPTKLRTDQAAPAIMIETETDVLSVLGYYPARQADSDHIRLWEVAGTAHADAIQIGSMESTLGCPTPINRGQQVFVLRAALQHLRDWVVDGTAPPHGESLTVDTSVTPPAYAHDDVGNVKGGVRTPVVDAPVDRLSGIARRQPVGDLPAPGLDHADPGRPAGLALPDVRRLPAEVHGGHRRRDRQGLRPAGRPRRHPRRRPADPHRLTPVHPGAGSRDPQIFSQASGPSGTVTPQSGSRARRARRCVRGT